MKVDLVTYKIYKRTVSLSSPFSAIPNIENSGHLRVFLSIISVIYDCLVNNLGVRSILPNASQVLNYLQHFLCPSTSLSKSQMNNILERI